MAMTARACFEGLLTELSKVNAPSMLLLDFNYFFNKAVAQYINRRYNIYDVNQLTTDDLRVLKATTLIEDIETPSISKNLESKGAGMAKLFSGIRYIDLPLDYLHMLNCICIYSVNKTNKCYDAGNYVQFAAKRLTSDSWSVIMNDFYNRPLPERPYYYINNVNTSNELPTNPITSDVLIRNSSGTDVYVAGLVSENQGDLEAVGEETAVSTETQNGFVELPKTININTLLNGKVSTLERSLVEKEAGVRYGNSSSIRCEIRYGQDDTFELVGVLIDYIKAPLTIRLTLEQVNLTEDTSLIMEFPDYVCLEIINELVHLVMENTADPRLLSHSIVTQTIASPVQQLPTQTPRSQVASD